MSFDQSWFFTVKQLCEMIAQFGADLECKTGP